MSIAMYRCAKCGSPHVTPETQVKSSGYSYTKGALGAFLFGTGGAVAGINGKTQTETVYKCADCGQSLSYCMPSTTKNEIESLMMKGGYTTVEEFNSWKVYRDMFPNLEECLNERNNRIREESKEKVIQQAINVLSPISEAEFVESTKAIYEPYWEMADRIGWSTWKRSTEEYKKFCDNIHILVHQLPRFDSYYIESFPDDSNTYPKWQRVYSKHYVHILIIFDMLLDYYHQTHRKFYTQGDKISFDFAYDYFFNKNLHLRGLAEKSGAIWGYVSKNWDDNIGNQIVRLVRPLPHLYVQIGAEEDDEEIDAEKASGFVLYPVNVIEDGRIVQPFSEED